MTRWTKSQSRRLYLYDLHHFACQRLYNERKGRKLSVYSAQCYCSFGSPICVFV